MSLSRKIPASDVNRATGGGPKPFRQKPGAGNGPSQPHGSAPSYAANGANPKPSKNPKGGGGWKYGGGA